ncbi:MAG: DUF2007 domain-containing protein [Burkholderia gladioli]
MLNAAGIGCELHNRFAPEIWLHDERDTALARRILEAARSGPPPGATRWRCGGCGEVLDAQFTACWHCGRTRDPRDEEAGPAD